MTAQPLSVPDVLLVTPRVFGDDRGAFHESWNSRTFAEIGIAARWVQDNQAESVRGVLRGLHCQVKQVQGKLVRAVVGEVFDVAVDVRASSPTFGKWCGARLSAENRQMLWVPEGFAHGYYVISERATVLYKASDFYAPESERVLKWDDPTVGVEWPTVTGMTPVLTARDRDGASLSAARAWFA